MCDRSDVFRIAIANIEDVASVERLLKASYPILMRGSYSAPIVAAALPFLTQVNPVLLSSGTFYLSRRQDNHVVGCGGWTFERPGNAEAVPGLAHIRHFATHPDLTGRGIGRAIYQRCEYEARLAGADRFECHASLNASKFYAALGFHDVQQIDVPMAPNTKLPGILMRRGI